MFGTGSPDLVVTGTASAGVSLLLSDGARGFSVTALAPSQAATDVALDDFNRVIVLSPRYVDAYIGAAADKLFPLDLSKLPRGSHWLILALHQNDHSPLQPWTQYAVEFVLK